MAPVLDYQRPIAAILERAIENAVRQKVMGQKYTQTVRNIDDVRSFG
jgi:hypothetical protein